MTHTSRLVVALLGLATACRGDGEVAAPQPVSALVASKLAVLAVGVATAPQGRSFFDNFLPCARRGVIDYRNTPRGRQATFSGCDAGDGVVVDGTAEVRWTGPGGNRDRIESIELIGPLYVRPTDGRSVLDQVDRIEVRGITFADPQYPSVESLATDVVRVTVAGVTTPIDARARPDLIFHPSLAIDAIPNPGNSLAELTEADLKRIAYHGALAIARTLFNETLEIQRGAHTHTEPCGTMRVTPDAANLPRLDMTWTACDARHGLLVGGTFSTRWSEFAPQAGRMAMVVDGALTLGGGVPMVTLSRLEWAVSGLGSFPATIRIAGRLVSGAQQRTYAFDVLVDD